MKFGDQSYRVAVILPCYNEEAAIGDVVRDFRAALPEAVVYVYDNNSKDGTILRARAAGAVVRSETRQGKGQVVRRMFADVEADIYVLADGDGTYDAAGAPSMIEQLVAGLDIVGIVEGIGQAGTAYFLHADAQAHALAAQDKLAEAELKIQQLEKTAGGEFKLKPLATELSEERL